MLYPTVSGHNGDYMTTDADVVAVARAHYAELTRRIDIIRPGAPFMTWDELPTEQRTVQIEAVRAAIAADPVRAVLIEALEQIGELDDEKCGMWFKVARRQIDIALAALARTRGEQTKAEDTP